MRRVDRVRAHGGELVVAGAAGVAIFASLTALRVQPPEAWSAPTFVAFVLLIAASMLTEVDLATDVRYPLGLAPALAYALFAHHTLPETILVFAAGVTLATVVRALRRSDLRIFDAAVQVLALASAVAALRALAAIAPDPAFRTPDGIAFIPLAGFAVMLVALGSTETLLHAADTAVRDRVPVLAAARDRGRATAAVHVSQASVAALLALAYPSLGAWAFPLFLAPLAATRFAFQQFSSIRRTYLQTIRALSKVPEMAGYSAEGHSTRVARTAVAVARELGIAAPEVKEIEYAALLHDIGRVSLPEPGPPDAGDRERLAGIGAQIVRQTRHFPRVAEMIEHQHADASLSTGPVGARIIRACSDLDDLLTSVGEDDALVRIRAGAGLYYDADVVRALETVCERGGLTDAA